MPSSHNPEKHISLLISERISNREKARFSSLLCELSVGFYKNLRSNLLLKCWFWVLPAAGKAAYSAKVHWRTVLAMGHACSNLKMRSSCKKPLGLCGNPLGPKFWGVQENLTLLLCSII